MRYSLKKSVIRGFQCVWWQSLVLLGASNYVFSSQKVYPRVFCFMHLFSIVSFIAHSVLNVCETKSPKSERPCFVKNLACLLLVQ